VTVLTTYGMEMWTDVYEFHFGEGDSAYLILPHLKIFFHQFTKPKLTNIVVLILRDAVESL
jgi:hypothetical protein